MYYISVAWLEWPACWSAQTEYECSVLCTPPVLPLYRQALTSLLTPLAELTNLPVWKSFSCGKTLAGQNNVGGIRPDLSDWLMSPGTTRQAAPCVILLWKAWGGEQCRAEHMVRLSSPGSHRTSPCTTLGFTWSPGRRCLVMLCHCVSVLPHYRTKGKHLGIDWRGEQRQHHHNNDIL